MESLSIRIATVTHLWGSSASSGPVQPSRVFPSHVWTWNAQKLVGLPLRKSPTASALSDDSRNATATRKDAVLFLSSSFLNSGDSISTRLVIASASRSCDLPGARVELAARTQA